MNTLRTNPLIIQRQRGAALIIMLVIMIMGVSFFLVSALSNSSLHIARDMKTSDVLAQAKEALLARSVADSTQPGSLPCPDNHPPGSGLEGTADSPCTSYIGRLPWKTLGLPDLRDASGALLWYALSKNFHKNPGVNHINSDTVGTLSISGNSSSGSVVAIVFAPGPNLNGQSRSDIQIGTCGSVESLCASNYLEGVNANPSPAALPNTQYISDSSIVFNDQMIYITTDNLLTNVEKRIARDIKQCLDNYAALPSATNPAQANGKYPWPAPVFPLGYTSVTGTLFGRVPDQPTINTPVGGSADPNITALTNALNNLQAAVNNCQTNDTLQAPLTTAGTALLAAVGGINNPPYATFFGGTFVSNATAAGNAAINSNACNNIESNPTANAVQNKLNSVYSNFPASVTEDLSMPTSWPACILFAPPAYWADWKEMVFYSVSNAYRPNGTKVCAANCLSVNGNGNPNSGSGSYRAAVIVAGKNLTQAARVPANLPTYLEGVNSAVPSTTTLETWQLTEQKAKNINDFVVCIDGKGIDQNSKCY